MFPVIQFLIAALLARVFMEPDMNLGPDGTPLPIDVVRTCVGTLFLILCIVPVGWWLRHRLRRRLAQARNDATRWGPAVLGYYRELTLFKAAPIGVYAAICVWLGWPWMVAQSGLEGWVLVDELAALVPFVAAQVVTWIFQFLLDRLLTGRGFRLWPYLKFQFRQVLLPFIPVLGLMAVWDIVETSPTAQLYLFVAYPFLTYVLVLGMLVVLYVCSGLLMRWIFRAKRLPDGPLRERLLAFARRVDFRGRDLLVWHTGLQLINAAVIGGVRRLRYVLFTEGMLESFNGDEIEAVLAHEVGHTKGRHIHLYFVFALNLLFLFQLLYELLVATVPQLFTEFRYADIILFVVVVLVYWRAVFGFVSRKFEREADLFAAIAVGDHRRFVEALEQVAVKSGTLRTLPSWRHHSIAQRVAFLEQAFTDVDVLEAFRRSVRRVKVGLLVVLVAAMGLVLRNVNHEVRAGHLLVTAADAVKQGDENEARRALAQGLGEAETAPVLMGAVGHYCYLIKDRRFEQRFERVFHEAMIQDANRRLEQKDLKGVHQRVTDLYAEQARWSEEIRDSVNEFCRAFHEGLIQDANHRLEQNDPEGALQRFRDLYEERAHWSEETREKANQLRRQLRQLRDQQSTP